MSDPGKQPLGEMPAATLRDRLLRVVKYQVDANHRWCDRCLRELNSRTWRILSHTPNAAKPSTEFYQWESNARI